MNMFLSQKKFLNNVAEESVIWVCPSSVKVHYGTDNPLLDPVKILCRKKIKSNKFRQSLNKHVFMPLAPFVIPKRVFPRGVAIETMAKYERITDLIKNIDNLESTVWYNNLTGELSLKGFSSHKKNLFYSEKSILSFLESYRNEVVLSIASNGFSKAYTGYASAIIDSNGCIGKTSSGNHRFFIARVLGKSSFPLRIVGVHQHWYQRLKRVSGNISYDIILDAFKEIELRHRSDSDDNIQ